MRIEFHPDVVRQLQRLQHEVAETALAVIEGLAERPRPRGAKKLAGRNNDWRLRSGQYRIVYEIDDADDVVRIFMVAKLGDAYREPDAPRAAGAARGPELVIGRYSGRLISARVPRSHPTPPG